MQVNHPEDSDFLLASETKRIIGIGFEIYNQLGIGFLEIVYKDAFEFEFRKGGILFEREKQYEIKYKGIVLPHKFYADFIVFDSVILEVKCQAGISEADLAQTLNYLRCSGCKVGLILNFGKQKLEIKRVIL